METETRQVISLAAGFFLLPAFVSLSLRASVIDPLLYFLQAENNSPQEFRLTKHQWRELTREVDEVERRLKYDVRMGHAPPLSEAALEDKLREVGLQLEAVERSRCREAVGNTLSDTLGTVLLFTGFWFNRGRLRALRQGLFARFLSLEARSVRLR